MFRGKQLNHHQRLSETLFCELDENLFILFLTLFHTSDCWLVGYYQDMNVLTMQEYFFYIFFYE
jgi:hypothetical protein